MTQRHDRGTIGLDRRAFLRRLGMGTAASAMMVGAARAGDDKVLQALIEQNQDSGFGQGFDSASRTILMPKASLPTLSPSSVQATEQAIAHYQEIVRAGGWPAVPSVKGDLRLGNRHPSVKALRQRLMLAGDMARDSAVTDVFDSYVEAGVRRFQARHGLSIDGIVREASFNELNVPAPTRLDKLNLNMARLRSATANLPPRYVVCNIPAARIEAVENGIVVSRHTAVVGKPDRPSPEIHSKVIEINFNPYWTVPVSIVRRDLIPIMQKQPDYLTQNRIRIFDAKGNELKADQIDWNSNQAVNYRFKQDPGDFNSLGTIRINFPNPYSVYMHDTPFKNLFGEDFRFDSSGCVRVQNVRELVAWLLAETPGWSRQEIDQVIKSGERKDARLAKPVPVYWVYLTAWATSDGVVQFRDDIYHRDGVGPTAAVTRG